MAYEFIIPAHWMQQGDYHVTADSLEEAIDHVQGMSEYPEEYEYVDGSHTIADEEVLEEVNAGVMECIKVDKAPKEELPLLIGALKTEEAKIRLEERMKQ